MDKSSRLPGFYEQSVQQRAEQVAAWADLDEAERAILAGPGLMADRANQMIENVIGTHALPLGVAVNFLVNGHDYLIPMAIEEPSVVAACSYMARIVRDAGGFHTCSTDPVMIAQIQVLDLADPWAAKFDLLSQKQRLLERWLLWCANLQYPMCMSLVWSRCPHQLCSILPLWEMKRL